jgi:uncharacterized protein
MRLHRDHGGGKTCEGAWAAKGRRRCGAVITNHRFCFLSVRGAREVDTAKAYCLRSLVRGQTGKMRSAFLGVGWAFPVAVERRDANPRLAVAEYEESVRQAIQIILGTAKGERVMHPDFGCGLEDLVFAVNDSGTRGLVEHAVREALQLWEPRIEVLDVVVREDGDVGEQLCIAIDYRVRLTDNRFNLVYPFYLNRGGV